MSIVTVSAKGWVVIPAELRKKYHLTPGSQVRIVDYGGTLALISVPDDPIRDMKGMLKGGRSLTAALAAEHQAERNHGR